MCDNHDIGAGRLQMGTEGLAKSAPCSKEADIGLAYTRQATYRYARSEHE